MYLERYECKPYRDMILFYFSLMTKGTYIWIDKRVWCVKWHKIIIKLGDLVCEMAYDHQQLYRTNSTNFPGIVCVKYHLHWMLIAD